MIRQILGRPTPSQSFVERVDGDQALCRYSRPLLDNSVSLWLAIGQLVLEGGYQIFQSEVGGKCLVVTLGTDCVTKQGCD